MSASDMLCVMCSRTAFAFIAAEIPVGRARWPVCARTECIDRVMNQATSALHRAASKSYSTGPADAIDTTASDTVGGYSSGPHVVDPARLPQPPPGPAPGAIDARSDERPHSRACGYQHHEHGLACHTNCPTCHGTITKVAGYIDASQQWIDALPDA